MTPDGILASLEAELTHARSDLRDATSAYSDAVERASHDQPLPFDQYTDLRDIVNQREGDMTDVIVDHAQQLADWLAAHHPGTRIEIALTALNDTRLLNVHDPSGHVHAFASHIPERHLFARALRHATGGRLPPGIYTLSPEGLSKD